MLVLGIKDGHKDQNADCKGGDSDGPFDEPVKSFFLHRNIHAAVLMVCHFNYP
jgi:hypothetical protein